MIFVPTCDIEWQDYVTKAQETLKVKALSLSSVPTRQTYADLLSILFSDDDASFTILSDHLNAIHNLEENWDSYGAEVPSPESIELARQAIERFRHGRLLPDSVVPSAEGGVVHPCRTGHGS